MKRVRKYTFEVDFFKVKGQRFQAEAVVKSLGFDARVSGDKTYYTLEYEDRKVDFHADYAAEKNTYVFKTERPDSGGRANRVRKFYRDLPSALHIPSFRLTKGVLITDTRAFIKSHLRYLDGLGKKAREPYLDRLEALAQIIRIELL